MENIIDKNVKLKNFINNNLTNTFITKYKPYVIDDITIDSE